MLARLVRRLWWNTSGERVQECEKLMLNPCDLYVGKVRPFFFLFTWKRKPFFLFDKVRVQDSTNWRDGASQSVMKVKCNHMMWSHVSDSNWWNQKDIVSYLQGGNHRDYPSNQRVFAYGSRRGALSVWLSANEVRICIGMDHWSCLFGPGKINSR
jgi:hypothetical protein